MLPVTGYRCIAGLSLMSALLVSNLALAAEGKSNTKEYLKSVKVVNESGNDLGFRIYHKGKTTYECTGDIEVAKGQSHEYKPTGNQCPYNEDLWVRIDGDNKMNRCHVPIKSMDFTVTYNGGDSCTPAGE